MNLFLRQNIKNLLKKHHTRPLKRFGQNFLIREAIGEKIIQAADLASVDIVLEIGPGIGNLTQELAKEVKKVIAIEKDSKMLEILKETVGDFKNVRVIREDILKSNIQNLISNIQYKVVGNLPFYLTAPVIRKFLESKNPPREMVFIVQKEVAQRICAKPPKMNLLAVSVQFYAKPTIISHISRASFWPQPKVDSAIIKIIPTFSPGKKSTIVGILPNEFFRIVKAGFSHPRKQLINNLSHLCPSLPAGRQGYSGQAKELKIERSKIKNWLLKNKINPTQRAETLRIEDWMALTKNCHFVDN